MNKQRLAESVALVNKLTVRFGSEELRRRQAALAKKPEVKREVYVETMGNRCVLYTYSAGQLYQITSKRDMAAMREYLGKNKYQNVVWRETSCENIRNWNVKRFA